jgi:aryl-alcohol dehydrogenase-like predicted oxidoreductase
MTFGYQTEQDEAFRILNAAVDAGVTFYDCADVYPVGSDVPGTSEEILGAWLKTQARDSVVVATKCFGATGPGPNDRGLSRSHILNAVDASLRRLGTDYIDLYQVHHPDPNVPIDETLGALDDLVRWGKVRYVGTSNFPSWRLALAIGLSERRGVVRFDCDQPRYNLLYRAAEDELLPLAREEGLGIIAYNPLAGGFLTGKYAGPEDLREGTRFMLGSAAGRYQDRYWHKAQFREVERLKAYFAEREISLTHAAIAWVLAQEGVTSAIVGASLAEQIADSLHAVEIELTEDDMAFCDAAWFNLPRRDRAAAR